MKYYYTCLILLQKFYECFLSFPDWVKRSTVAEPITKYYMLTELLE